MHPFSHKLAAFRSYIHRLVNVPMSQENFQVELNIIKQIAINNGYTSHLIDKMVEKKLFKQAIALVYPPPANLPPQKYHVLTYIGSISDQIHKHIKFKNNKLSFRTNNSLGKYIRNNKSKTVKEEKSGVYQLNCGSCNKIYIGQTGRAFKERIVDHSRSFRLEDGKSEYAEHVLLENHIFDDNFEILHVSNKGLKLNALESLEINKRKFDNILLNDQLDLNSSPLLNLFRY